MATSCSPRVLFQSTLPARGATAARCFWKSLDWFQSTLPARGATRRHAPQRGHLTCFNPRSRRGERPALTWPSNPTTYRFNPRSRRGERRFGNPTSAAVALFQSTLPARGATQHRKTLPAWQGFQSTLPARGATPVSRRVACVERVSIHAPGEGSDAGVRGGRRLQRVSIHAPGEGSDLHAQP